MKKTIWILNHHANDTYFDKGGRHYSIAKYLVKEGYNPIIFCSNAEHGTNQLYFDNNVLWQEKKDQKNNITYVFVSGKPYKGNGKDRIICMLNYYFNMKKVAKEYSKLNGEPDIIIGSQVHPLAIVRAIKLARKFKTKCIAEIRDLWPESIVAYGLASEKNIIIRLLRLMEKWIYSNCDKLLFTMEEAYNYIESMKWEKIVPREKVFFINNGVDLEDYYFNRENNRIEDSDLEDDSIFKIVYTGSIRAANRIELLVETAKLIHDEKVKILVWGDGDQLPLLKQMVKDNNLNNIVFKGRVDKKSIPYIISKANINFLDAFDENVSKYGISSNKLFEYFAAEKPILISEMKYYPMKGADYLIPYKQNAEDIYNKILMIYGLQKDIYNELCRKTNEAIKIYNYESITDRLISVIEG